MEIEAQEAEALLIEKPEFRSGFGAIRALGIALGAGTLVVVGVKTMWHEPARASADGIVLLTEAETSGACSHNGWDCQDTKCCIDPASKCYKKSGHWASCNETCSTNMKWNDTANAWAKTDNENEQWACDDLSEEHSSSDTGGESGESGETQPVACSAAGDSCLDSKCCADSYHKCYTKNEHWASCNATCSNKMKWVDNAWQKQDEHVWDCDELKHDGPTGKTDNQAPEDICTKAGENCMLSKCCQDAGHTCYTKDEHWASCNLTCSSTWKWESGGWNDKGEHVWDCDELQKNDEDAEQSFCDMSGCQECSGSQCGSCREEAERDCCLNTMCKRCEGEQCTACRNDNMETCCEGKSAKCKPVQPSV